MIKEFLIFIGGLGISIIMGIIGMQVRLSRQLTVKEKCIAVIFCSIAWFLGYVFITQFLLPANKIKIILID